ncbi:hypothetical protein MPNT_260008 [Candidatus Methylacidithermus pantelleriae]|uniref:Uncharacterized protein n=1 Tax=Candidatus Methylacidithermus pantelleriae TaxID=2744239 RepID=A0A8J2FSE5_9BACT|nr:hypothetical protein MPNT_260008 [Candidatus Methylacidithermus pantelleriae]
MGKKGFRRFQVCGPKGGAIPSTHARNKAFKSFHLAGGLRVFNRVGFPSRCRNAGWRCVSNG